MGISSNELIDVSFAGASVTLAGITVKNFMDDANPIEIPDTEVTSAGVNCNGVMIRNAKPNIITLSVTVIPGSDEDRRFYDLWKRYRVQNGINNAGQWETSLTGTIVTKGTRGRTYGFSGGTMISGPAGPTSNGEGKMQGRTYTFAFAVVN